MLLFSFNLPAFADTLSLDSITQKAIDASYELKIAHLDMAINQTDIKAARAEYYPTIRGTANFEKLKDLENQPTQVTTIGSTVLPSGTRYQNSVGVSLNQTLLDFGVRHHKIEMARHGTLAKAATYYQTLRDLRLKLVDLYTEALVSYHTLHTYETLLPLAQLQYQMKRRLYEAGTTSNVEVAEEAIQVAQLLDSIQTTQDQLKQQLENISYFTKEVYDLNALELADLTSEPESEAPHFSRDKTSEALLYEQLIQQKQSEIDMLKRQYLPQVSLYSYYNLYGFDPKQVNKAISSLAQRTVSLGLTVNLPIFDGFKTQAAIEKAKLEKEKLGVQKEEKLAQLQHQANLYQAQTDGYQVELETKAKILTKAQAKLLMVARLSDQKMVAQSQSVKEHMERIKKELDAEKSMIQGIAALKKLKILSEG